MHAILRALSAPLALTAALTVLPAAADHHMDGEHEVGTIVDVASGNGQFTTLVAALQAAGLAETLANGGPFTVFAPTDMAFERLPDGALQDLLDHPDQLAEVLKLHVVSGEARASDVVNLSSVETLAGTTLPISTAMGTVRVGQARVLTTDVEASNGVIHVIDDVILP